MSYDRKLKSERIKAALKLRYPNGRRGHLASNWRGGKRRAGSGGAYITIYAPDHPFCDGDGYVMEHRLVVENMIGRPLSPEEVVHHRNGIKDDNRIENLELLPSKAEHVKRHFEAVRRVHELEQENQRLRERLCELVGEA